MGFLPSPWSRSTDTTPGPAAPIFLENSHCYRFVVAHGPRRALLRHVLEDGRSREITGSNLQLIAGTKKEFQRVARLQTPQGAELGGNCNLAASRHSHFE